MKRGSVLPGTRTGQRNLTKRIVSRGKCCEDFWFLNIFVSNTEVAVQIITCLFTRYQRSPRVTTWRHLWCSCFSERHVTVGGFRHLWTSWNTMVDRWRPCRLLCCVKYYSQDHDHHPHSHLQRLWTLIGHVGWGGSFSLWGPCNSMGCTALTMLLHITLTFIHLWMECKLRKCVSVHNLSMKLNIMKLFYFKL